MTFFIEVVAVEQSVLVVGKYSVILVTTMSECVEKQLILVMDFFALIKRITFTQTICQMTDLSIREIDLTKNKNYGKIQFI